MPSASRPNQPWLGALPQIHIQPAGHGSGSGGIRVSVPEGVLSAVQQATVDKDGHAPGSQLGSSAQLLSPPCLQALLSWHSRMLGCPHVHLKGALKQRCPPGTGLQHQPQRLQSIQWRCPISADGQPAIECCRGSPAGRRIACPTLRQCLLLLCGGIKLG